MKKHVDFPVRKVSTFTAKILRFLAPEVRGYLLLLGGDWNHGIYVWVTIHIQCVYINKYIYIYGQRPPSTRT